jgi:2-polyprenyl-6-methoxyphenol hydroxylase-like FAD-dependent oxidoreductase
MPHLLPPVHTEVLVVGAGPVGLALAGDLGWRGRQALLIDKGDGSIFQPKMDLVQTLMGVHPAR